MLRLLLGVSGTGKPPICSERQRKHPNRESGSFFIVPEQYSFETEKAVTAFLAQGGEKIEAVSFFRLCNLIFRGVWRASGKPWMTAAGRCS